MAHGSVPQGLDDQGEPRGRVPGGDTHNRVSSQTGGSVLQGRDHYGDVNIYQGGKAPAGRPGRRWTPWAVTGAAVTALLLAVVLVNALPEAGTRVTADETAPVVPSATPTPLPSPTASAPDAVTTPEPQDGATASERKCRGWEEHIKVTEGALARPCVQFTGTSLLLSADVVVDGRMTGETTGVVWVWLYYGHPLAEEGRAELTRDESTLFRCVLELAPADGELHTCGPYEVVPEHEGRHTTAMAAGTRTDTEYPQGWDSPAFTGTMLGGFHWPTGDP